MALKGKVNESIQEGDLANYIYTPNNNKGGYRGRVGVEESIMAAKDKNSSMKRKNK